MVFERLFGTLSFFADVTSDSLHHLSKASQGLMLGTRLCCIARELRMICPRNNALFKYRYFSVATGWIQYNQYKNVYQYRSCRCVLGSKDLLSKSSPKSNQPTELPAWRGSMDTRMAVKRKAPESRSRLATR